MCKFNTGRVPILIFGHGRNTYCSLASSITECKVNQGNNLWHLSIDFLLLGLDVGHASLKAVHVAEYVLLFVLQKLDVLLPVLFLELLALLVGLGLVRLGVVALVVDPLRRCRKRTRRRCARGRRACRRADSDGIAPGIPRFREHRQLFYGLEQVVVRHVQLVVYHLARVSHLPLRPRQTHVVWAVIVAGAITRADVLRRDHVLVHADITVQRHKVFVVMHRQFDVLLG